jgi:superfamily II DNA helicase RecQ
MAFKFFMIPVSNSQALESELNEFLVRNTILSVERELIDQGSSSFWSFCIEYLDSRPNASRQIEGSRRRRKTIDYRDVLTDEQFEVFSKLRDRRKEIAQREGVPLYAIFNNEQLAQMVQKKARSKADLEAILGAGDARIEKYGEQFLEILRENQEESDEKSGESV